MKLFIGSSLVVFFGTLLAAALVALGEPGRAELAVNTAAVHAAPQAQQLALTRWISGGR